MPNLRPAAVVPLVVLALAACSSSTGGGTASSPAGPDSSYPGRSARQVFDAAEAAAAGAHDVTIEGRTTALGKPATFTITVMDGRGSVGTMSAGGTTAVQFRTIGRLSYILAGQAFYAAQGTAAASVGSKIGKRWLVADPSTMTGITGMGGDPSSDLSTRYPTVASILANTVPDGATLTRVPGQEVDGAPTTGIAFTAPVSSAAAAKISAAGGTVPTALTGTVYVATSSPSYPAAIRTNTGVDLKLRRWGKPVALTAPPKKDQIALNDLLTSVGFGS